MPVWTWSLEDVAGQPAEPAVPSPDSFEAQADAETWIGENWRALAAGGAEAAALSRDGVRVYGPMLLRPAG